jgi:RNA-directed DNA polymerase
MKCDRWASPFTRIDATLHHLLMRWAKFRHPRKGMRWVIRRYWQQPAWTFGPKDGSTLRKYSETRIRRHVKVQGAKSPFDGDWKYRASRQGHYPGVTPWLAMVLRRQGGKCAHCGMQFMPEDLIEVHHAVRKCVNTSRTTLKALHRHCHDQVHGSVNDVSPDDQQESE